MVTYHIENDITWNWDKLKGQLPNYIVDKIMHILIHISDISDTIIWKFSSDDKLFVKTITWQIMIKFFHILKQKY